ncbi:hypothetical protein SEPCBS57363_002967 [Sporothrix epigloea]|uniref:Argonaute complex, subunit Arb1 n=1 Tax=Sporothrix epigloea TaxID=1892477 RepID=A0ABP0DMF3_9PEZI
MSSAVEHQKVSGDATGVTEPLPNEITGTNNDSRSDNGTVDMHEATTVGRKKKKSKSIASRGPTALPKRCGTGFEEYYAEPPLTVVEYEEEMDLYHARIETCIQRYRARRHLDNERTNLFNRYLKMGGIDCNPRMFNGAADFEEGETMTKDEVRALTATDVVSRAGSKVSKYYATDNAHMWTVDFSGVVAGFLSVSLCAIGGSNEKLMKVGIDVVDNFLRYLQHHDVCPEYEENIEESRAICEKAKVELPNCLRALARMPGQFNLACVKLFCNKPQHRVFDDGLDPLDYITDKDWDASHIFQTTVELQDRVIGTKATRMAKEDLDSIHIVQTHEMELEITRLVRSPKGVRERYAAMTKSSEEKMQPDAVASKNENATVSKSEIAIHVAGIVIAKHYSIEKGIANQPHPTADELTARGFQAFFLDRDIMELLCVGMKMRVVMHELNCDISFVSAVKELLPSFYLFLPQELMIDWKEPKPSEREAPSADNPDEEEDAAEKELEDDKE